MMTHFAVTTIIHFYRSRTALMVRPNFASKASLRTNPETNQYIMHDNNLTPSVINSNPILLLLLITSKTSDWPFS